MKMHAADADLRHPAERRPLGEQLALASGIGFVALNIAAASFAPEPTVATTQSPEFVSWLVAQQAGLLVQSYLYDIAAFLMMIFAGGLVAAIRRARGDAGALGLVAIGASAAFSTVMFLSNIAGAAAAILAGQGADRGVVSALFALGNTMRAFNGIPGALMIGAAALGLLGARAIARPVGWFGLLAALILLIGSAGFPGTQLEAVNFAAFPFVLLWPLVTAIAALVRPRPARAQTRAGVATA